MASEDEFDALEFNFTAEELDGVPQLSTQLAVPVNASSLSTLISSDSLVARPRSSTRSSGSSLFDGDFDNPAFLSQLNTSLTQLERRNNDYSASSSRQREDLAGARIEAPISVSTHQNEQINSRVPLRRIFRERTPNTESFHPPLQGETAVRPSDIALIHSGLSNSISGGSTTRELELRNSSRRSRNQSPPPSHIRHAPPGNLATAGPLHESPRKTMKVIHPSKGRDFSDGSSPSSSIKSLESGSPSTTIPIDVRETAKAIFKEYEEALSCTICSDYYVCPHMVIPCGHSFCGPCIALWFSVDAQRRRPTCPTCRANLSMPTLTVPNYAFEATVDAHIEALGKNGMKGWRVMSKNRTRDVVALEASELRTGWDERKRVWKAEQAEKAAAMKRAVESKRARTARASRGPENVNNFPPAIRWYIDVDEENESVFDSVRSEYDSDEG